MHASKGLAPFVGALAVSTMAAGFSLSMLLAAGGGLVWALGVAAAVAGAGSAGLMARREAAARRAKAAELSEALETARAEAEANRSASRDAASRADETAERLGKAEATLDALSRGGAQIVLSADGRIVEANDAFLTMTGYERAEVIGEPRTLLAGDGDEEDLWQTATHGAAARGEFACEKKSGARMSIAAVYSPVPGDGGAADRIICTLTDITEAEAKRKTSAARSAAFEAAPTAMLTLDREGRIAELNASMRALVAQGPLAERWPSLASGEAAGSELALFGNDLSQQRALLADSSQLPLRRDIEGAMLEATVTPVLNAAGAIDGHVVSFTEAAAKQAGDALRQACGTSALFEYSADGTITGFNEAALSLTGLERDKLLHSKHDALVIEPSADYRNAWAALAEGAARGLRVERRRGKDERAVTDSVFLPLKGADGRVVRIVELARDATALVAEERDREAQLAAIEGASGRIEFDLEGRILDANDQFLDMVGYGLEEIVEQHHRMFARASHAASPGYGAFWERIIKSSGETGTHFLIGEGGRKVWARITFTSVRDEKGEPVRIIGLTEDVTEEHKLTLDAVRKAQAFDEATTPVLVTDRDFVVQHANSAGSRFLKDARHVLAEAASGFDFEQPMGQRLTELHPDLVGLMIDARSAEKLPYEGDIIVGKSRFGITVNILQDADGGRAGYLVAWQDVTKQRVHTGLVEAFDRSQALIEFELDGTIRQVNQNFLDAVGYENDEVVGRHHSMFVCPEFADTREYSEAWEALARGEPQSGLYRRQKKNGEDIYFQAAYTPVLDRDGNPELVIMAANNVTEFRNRRKAEKAENQRGQEELRSVTTALAEGLRELSNGNFDYVLTEHFPERFRQLRYDFNDALFKLKESEELRSKVAADQNDVVERLAAALEALSSGILTYQIDHPFAAEYEKLRVDFNGAIERLRDVLASIAGTAVGIERGSKEITQAADDLSTRTENQAATLEETAAALSEITTTVRQTAESAKEVNRVASNAREGAKESGVVVQNAVAAMGEIEKSSAQISQIIGVIDDIAFQTNLLALNAGVEAARAGDAGRGFAVVAQEVRALAQRSSEAAKEIKVLISTSSEQVGRGVDLVGRAGEALVDIVRRVENVSALVSDIASSAQEQSISLAEINSAMTKMDQVTQQNAAMVEETTAASHSLADASSDLIEHVAHFETGVVLDTGLAERSGDDTRWSDNPVRQQREAAEAFFAGAGGAAEKLESDLEDWEEF